jgi:hypothetical protein
MGDHYLALPESERIDRHQNGLPISDLLYPATCFLPFVGRVHLRHHHLSTL